jgi:hypothetical protein
VTLRGQPGTSLPMLSRWLTRMAQGGEGPGLQV